MSKARVPSPSTPPRVACPHLGRGAARHAPLGRPADAHRCFFADPGGERIKHRHQAQCCLNPDWASCYKFPPGYVPPASIPVAPPAPPPAPAPPEASPHLSLAAKRLLSHTARQAALPAEPPAPTPAPSSPVLSKLPPLDAIPPPPLAVLRQRPATPAEPPPVAPLPVAAPTPNGRGWQSALLWTVVALPGTLFLVVVGLLAFSILTNAPQGTRTALAAALEEPGGQGALLELVAPTPVATFAPVGEPPEVTPVIPALPETLPTPRADPAVRPGPWPGTPATGSPDRIRAPRVGMDASVIPVGSYIVEEAGQLYRYYEVAEFAAGWHTNSSLPGFLGNVVLAGHHNTKGKVFEHAVDLEPGDFIFVDIDEQTYPYLVVIKEILPETIASEAQRNENGRWIAQTPDERLTLVTCWPPNGNTHRVIVVAIPAK